MSDVGEGLGTAVAGAALARAVEPAHGESGTGGTGETPLDHGHFAEQDCLNCGQPLAGPYCQACGQAAHLHRTLGAFLHDLAHGVLHLDGKTWRTLPMLAWRPGQLTRRYIDGERARFVSPMALFLFSVFLMFAVFQMLGLSAPTEIRGVDSLRTGVETGLEQARENRDAAAQALAAMAPDDPARPGKEEELATADQSITALERLQGVAARDPADLNLNFTGVDFIDEGLVRKWRENPSLMLYKLQANSYKFSWLLIPLSLPFVWLLFAWKRQYRAYDHTIFITYSLCFMTLLFVALSVLGTLGASSGWLVSAFSIIAPWHVYRQLRGAYGLSRFSATWRLVALIGCIGVILLLFLEILLLLGAA